MVNHFAKYAITSLIVDGTTNEEKLKTKCLYSDSD